MAAETKQITEYKAEPLRPRMAFEGEDEVFDAALLSETPDPKNGEVALHVARDGADSPVASTYMTPAQAYILAERLRTCAWIAEQLSTVKEAN